MSCDDIGLSLNSKACVPGAVSGNADVQVAFDSGSASGVLGLDLPSSRVGLETDLLAATPFVLVPAFFAAFVGWSSFLEVACPVAATLIAATMVCAALSGVLLGLPRCRFMLRFQVVTRCLLRCSFGLRFQMAMVEMLVATGALWSFRQEMVAVTCYAA